MTKAPRASAIAIWEAALPAVEKVLGPEVRQNWLNQLTPIDVLGSEFYLSAPSELVQNWVTNRYSDELLRALRRTHPELKQVYIKAAPSAPAIITPPSSLQGGKNISFVHAGLCQVFFPRKQVEFRSHERASGSASLLMEAGKVYHRGKWVEVPLPYGGKARTLMTEIQSQVTKTGSTTIDLDRSMRAFAEKHAIHQDGRSLKMLANQAVYLGSATILLGYRNAENEDVTLGGRVAKQVSIWSVDDNQPSLWPNTLELSTDFRDAILEHHVPIKREAMHALDHNPLGQDFYVFFAYRLHVIPSGKPAKIPWAFLHQQFEGIRLDEKGREIRPENINSYYPWRKRAAEAIKQALEQYPEAKVESTRDHLVLHHSPPPIRKIMTASLGRP